MSQNVSNALVKRQNNIAALIERQKPEIARALPKQLNPDRLARIATTVMRQAPRLGEADPASFLGALMTCAQLGLEPGPLGHAYLVPFKNNKRGTTEVQFIPGYRGLVELARRSGQLQSVTARVVRKGDSFSYSFGLEPKLDHTPCGELGDVTYVYAVLKLKDGGIDFDVMTTAEVEGIRKRSKSANDGPWVTDYAEMAKKTVLRRLLKTAPMSVEYQQAAAQDEQVRTDIGFDGLDLEVPDDTPHADVLDGEVVDDQPPAELAASETTQDAENGTQPSEPRASKQQRDDITAALGKLEIKDSAERMNTLSALVGRQVTLTDLTELEGGQVLDMLTRCLEADDPINSLDSVLGELQESEATA